MGSVPSQMTIAFARMKRSRNCLEGVATDCDPCSPSLIARSTASGSTAAPYTLRRRIGGAASLSWIFLVTSLAPLTHFFRPTSPATMHEGTVYAVY